MNYQYIFSRVIGVALSLMILGLLSVTAYAAEPGPVDMNQALPAATHCAAIGDDATSSTLLAANPELSTVCRFDRTLNVNRALPAATHCAAIEVNSTLLATNPELSTVCRFDQTGLEKEATVDNSFPNMAEVDAVGNPADNPELGVARRYIPVEKEINPDSDIGLLEFFTVPNETSEQRASERKADEDIGLLEFFGSPTIKDVNASDQLSTFLAANPELSIARRYGAQVEWNRLYHPGR
jgi:hypothetical protein